MAQAASSSNAKAAAGCNFVAQDKIWKDHVDLEYESSKKWPENWKFLTGPYQDFVKDEYPRQNKPKTDAKTLIQVPPVTPIERYIHVEPSPKPVPVTTARYVGWRSTEPSLALEKYGRYAKPKGGLVKQLNWPNEAIS